MPPIPPVTPVAPAGRVQSVDFAELGAAAAHNRGGEAMPSWAKGAPAKVVEWSPGDAPAARPERHERAERHERHERGDRERPEPARPDRERPEPARPERAAPAERAEAPPRGDRVERMPERPEPRAAEPELGPDLADELDGGEGGGGEFGLAAGMIVVSEAELAQRDAEVAEAAIAPYREAIARFDRVVNELEQRLREDIVDLSARIASALAQRELKLDRTLVLDIARRALRLLGPLERVIVKCAESDAELLREHLPTLARAEAGRPVEVLVRPSDDILAGGLLLTFDGGVVDAREERRLQRIVDAVKAAIQELENQFDPDEAGRGPSRPGEGGAP